MSIGISLGAIGLSVVALFGWPSPASSSGMQRFASTPVALSNGSPFEATCPGDDPVDALGDVMLKRINPALTQMSFALFHDRRDLPERMETVRLQAERISGCLQLASHFRPEIRLDGLSRYHGMLEAAVENASLVRLAATELDERAASHWFMHMKYECARCHDEFRPVASAQ